MRHVEQRLDVVHDRRLAVEADLDREGRLVARLAAVALDRLEECGLLPAHVGAGADAQLDLDTEVGAVDRVLQPLVRKRVLRADVDEGSLAAGRVRGDRHRLDQPERILLHEDAILEGAGLRLVGVADEVVRRRRLPRDGLPLHARRERGAATAEQRGRLDELDHALRAELACTFERAELRRRFRIDALGDAAEQLQAGCLRQRRRRRRDLLLTRLRPGDRAQRGGRTLAEPETRRLDRAFGHLGAGEPAREVGADVKHLSGTLFEREQRVEGRDPVRVGRRHVEAARGVAERARRDPAHAQLRRAKSRQK